MSLVPHARDGLAHEELRRAPFFGTNFCTRPLSTSATYRLPCWSTLMPWTPHNAPGNIPSVPTRRAGVPADREQHACCGRTSRYSGRRPGRGDAGSTDRVDLPVTELAVLVEHLHAMVVAIVDEHAPADRIDRDAVDVVHVARARLVGRVALDAPVHQELPVLVELRDACPCTVGHEEGPVGQPVHERRPVEVRRVRASCSGVPMVCTSCFPSCVNL